MALARINRSEERKAKQRLLIASIGSLIVLVILGIFGLPAFINFSLFIDTLRGTTAPKEEVTSLLLSPSLDPLPSASNSATLSVSGHAIKGNIVIIYINDSEAKKITVNDDSGMFVVTGISVKEGNIKITAKQISPSGDASHVSDPMHTLIDRKPPLVEITAPEPNAFIRGENRVIKASGSVDDATVITINDRIVVISPDGTFHHDIALEEGENVITVHALDDAGNTTSVERIVIYERE